MAILAVIVIILACIEIFGGPLRIGKDQGLYSATDYIVSLIAKFMLIGLCGRVLDWW